MPHPKRQCNFIHPKQLSPFPERLELPFPSEEILSDYEEVVSFSQDRYTTWVKADPDVTSVRHLVDVRKGRSQSSARHPQEDTIHLLRSVTSTTTCLIVHMYKNSSASTAGILGLDAEKKMPSKSKLQEGGISLPCRRRPNMLTMSSSRIAST